ncbi:MAG: type IV pilin protein [Inhella sp.]
MPVIVRSAVGPHGFTLIELILAVVVVSLLTMVAVPAYLEQLRKSRRADAQSQSALISLAQERYRLGHSSFAKNIGDLAAEGVEALSAGGHYHASINEGTGVGYTVTIRPVPGGRQAGDAQCAEFKVVMLRGGLTRIARDSGGGDSSRRCWPQ